MRFWSTFGVERIGNAGISEMRTHARLLSVSGQILTLIVFSLPTMFGLLGAAAEPARQSADVDRSLFPKGYGTLASERLMYPIEMADWPVRISRKRQLFIDDHLIADRTNLTRRLHQAARDPANPVLQLREKPWEQSFGHSVFVLPTEDGTGYRMWYNLRHFVKSEAGVQYRAPTCYAESTDGIRWTKPELGIFKFGLDKQNNISLPQGSIDGLFWEPAEPNPNRRYKALVWHDPKDQKKYAPREGFYLYWSPDGIHWQGDNQHCIMPHGAAYNFPSDLADGVGDTTQFRWDTRLKKYVANVKILFRNPTLRTAGFSESDDLFHWSRPRMTMHRDELDDSDTQIYEHITFEYESLWIGLVRVMHTERTGWKQVDVEMSCSRDGRNWTRVCRGQRFLPLGAADAWDADYLIPGRPGNPLLVDNQLRFYYWGARRTDERDGSAIRHNMHIGIASLRRDGFVSLDAGLQPGRVTTRPLTFEGKQLYVNADIGVDGYLKAELQDASGEAIVGYQMQDCKAVQGDVVSGKVRWQSSDRIDQSSDNSLRLAFELKNAKLYSFWIE
jgi:hypothetical protein